MQEISTFLVILHCQYQKACFTSKLLFKFKDHDCAMGIYQIIFKILEIGSIRIQMKKIAKKSHCNKTWCSSMANFIVKFFPQMLNYQGLLVRSILVTVIIFMQIGPKQNNLIISTYLFSVSDHIKEGGFVAIREMI